MADNATSLPLDTLLNEHKAQLIKHDMKSAIYIHISLNYIAFVVISFYFMLFLFTWLCFCQVIVLPLYLPYSALVEGVKSPSESKTAYLHWLHQYCCLALYCMQCAYKSNDQTNEGEQSLAAVEEGIVHAANTLYVKVLHTSTPQLIDSRN